MFPSLRVLCRTSPLHPDAACRKGVKLLIDQLPCRDKIKAPSDPQQVSGAMWTDGKNLMCHLIVAQNLRSPAGNDCLWLSPSQSRVIQLKLAGSMGDDTYTFIRQEGKVAAPPFSHIQRGLYVLLPEHAKVPQDDKLQQFTLQTITEPPRNSDGTERPADAWLNPMMVELEGLGDDVAQPDISKLVSASNRLVLDLTPASVAQVAAVLLRRHVARKLENAPPGYIDSLLCGPRNDRAEQASLAAVLLDSLEGTFLLDPGGETPVGWAGSAEIAGENRRWFIHQLLDIWGGTAIDFGTLVRLVPAGCGLAGIGGDARGSAATATVPKGAEKRLNDLLRCLAQCELPDDAGTAVHLLAEVAADPDFPEEIQERHAQFVFPGAGRGPVRVAIIPLLEMLADKWFMPRSRVWVRMPNAKIVGADAEQKSAYAEAREIIVVDLCRSVRRRGYRFLTALASGIARRRESPWRVPHRFDWWNSWLDQFYGATLQTQFVLEAEQGGFLLGDSPLGESVLGEEHGRYVQGQHIRF